MRLIDADTLIEKASKDGAYGYVSVKEIYDIPTAYDVEAVVRELEDKVKFYENQEKRQMELDCGMVACHTNGVQQGIKFAIEIVKRGGRNE